MLRARLLSTMSPVSSSPSDDEDTEEPCNRTMIPEEDDDNNDGKQSTNTSEGSVFCTARGDMFIFASTIVDEIQQTSPSFLESEHVKMDI